jgi:hypothetical protein
VNIDTWPADASSPIFIRGYRGGDSYEALIEAFHADAVLLLSQGYEPAGQHYIDGRWSLWRALGATLLIAVFVGLLFWAQMLVQRPIGTLTVTYVYRGAKK